MTERADLRFAHLAPATAKRGAALARTKRLAEVYLVLLAGLGSLYLGVLVVGLGARSARSARVWGCLIDCRTQ